MAQFRPVPALAGHASACRIAPSAQTAPAISADVAGAVDHIEQAFAVCLRADEPDQEEGFRQADAGIETADPVQRGYAGAEGVEEIEEGLERPPDRRDAAPQTSRIRPSTQPTATTRAK